MMLHSVLFYIFALVMLGAACGVVFSRNPVHSVMFLVLTFFQSAILWLMIEAEFLAIVLVLVYVGAVMVLFLFVVMMLDINLARIKEGFIHYLPLGIAVAVLMAAMMILAVGPEYFGLDKFVAPTPRPADYSNTRELGDILYTVYVYPFEIASVILLVAIVAAITLTLRRRPNVKKQKPEEQIAVKRNDRVRMVNMPTEERK